MSKLLKVTCTKISLAYVQYENNLICYNFINLIYKCGRTKKNVQFVIEKEKFRNQLSKKDWKKQIFKCIAQWGGGEQTGLKSPFVPKNYTALFIINHGWHTPPSKRKKKLLNHSSVNWVKINLIKLFWTELKANLERI